MHKRYDLLNELGDCFREGMELRKDNRVILTKDEIRKFLFKLQDYYEMNDLETGKVHGKIFTALYMDGFATYNSVAYKFYIREYQLDRYRQRYNKFALRLFRRDFYPAKSVG